MQFIKYFFVGGIAALANLGLFYLFSSVLVFNYMLSGAIAFVIATGINYLLSILFVFRSGSRFRKGYEVTLVFIVSLIGLGANQLILFVTVSYLKIIPIIAQAISIGIAFFWNYLSRKKFVFKKDE